MVTTVCICAIAKDENLQIQEWVDQHLQHVDFIHLYDNSEPPQLQHLHGYKNRVKVTPWNTFPYQMTAQNHFIHKEAKAQTQIGMIDIDEFIVRYTSQESFGQWLAKMCPGGAIGLNWRIFGSSGHKQFTDEPVRKRFQMCESKLNHHVKCFGKVSDILKSVNPHFFQLRRNISRNALGRPFTNHSSPTGLDQPDAMPWVLHHQHVKSEDEYRKKIERGRANVREKRPWGNFAQHDLNEVFNDRALR